MKLLQHRYGKAHVRVLKVIRAGREHTIKELDVSVALQGDFEASYAKADNRLVVATDSLKNTVNVFAKRQLGRENEEFGVTLAKHFLKTYSHVKRVEIDLVEHCWDRISVGKKRHPHSFVEKGSATPIAKIVGTRQTMEVQSGVENLFILKSTGSGFENFLRDDYTTLAETADRIFATKLKALWTFKKSPRSFAATNAKILESMLSVFALDFSASVQATLFEMGGAALKAAREISQVHLTMPNKHCLLINLQPFGLKNQNELFVPTDEPHGLIEGTVVR